MQWLVGLIAYDWRRKIRMTWKHVVYVARYGYQSVDAIERWPESKLRRIAKDLDEAIRKEFKKK